MDDPIDEGLLGEAAQEAIGRFPYFAVRVGLDESQNYTLEPNGEPLPVLPSATSTSSSVGPRRTGISSP